MDACELLPLPRVLTVRGRGRSAHYKDVRQGLFPRPVAIGPRSRGWPAHEVVAINAARISGRSDEEIRQLVRRLEISRQEQDVLARFSMGLARP